MTDELTRDYSKSERDRDAPHCRICLESEGELIIPCDCKTNPIHRTCLDQWRAEVKDGKNFHRCEICHFTYEMEPISVSPPSWFKRQSTWYGLIIGWVILKALIILVGGISFWGVVCGFLDHKREMLRVLNLSPGQSYLLWGIILFFLTLDLYGIYYMIRKDACAGTGTGNVCNGCTGCIFIDCQGGSGDECELVCCLFCLLLAVVTGILIGLYIVSKEVKDASSKHLRVLGNYAVVDVTRVKDRTGIV
jgi:hypothetical protein